MIVLVRINIRNIPKTTHYLVNQANIIENKHTNYESYKKY